MGDQTVTMNGKQYQQTSTGQLVEIGRAPKAAPIVLPEQPSLAALAGEGLKDEAPVPDPKLMPYALMALQGMIGR